MLSLKIMPVSIALDVHVKVYRKRKTSGYSKNPEGEMSGEKCPGEMSYIHSIYLPQRDGRLS